MSYSLRSRIISFLLLIPALLDTGVWLSILCPQAQIRAKENSVATRDGRVGRSLVSNALMAALNVRNLGKLTGPDRLAAKLAIGSSRSLHPEAPPPAVCSYLGVHIATNFCPVWVSKSCFKQVNCTSLGHSCLVLHELVVYRQKLPFGQSAVLIAMESVFCKRLTSAPEFVTMR